MKRLLIALAAIPLAQFVNAQSYSITPGDTVTLEAVPHNLTDLTIYQNNLTADTLFLAWKKLSLQINESWDFGLCDYGTCHTGVPDSGTMLAILPGQSGFLSYKVIPSATPSVSTLRMYVYEVGSPNSGDTLTWLVTMTPTADVRVESDPPTIRLSPERMLTVSHGVGIIELWNPVGQLLSSRVSSGEDACFNMTGHPSGLYVLSIRQDATFRSFPVFICQ